MIRTENIGGIGLPVTKVAAAFESEGTGDTGVEFERAVPAKGEEARKCVAGLQKHAVVADREEGSVGRGDDVVHVQGRMRAVLCPWDVDLWVGRTEQRAV